MNDELKALQETAAQARAKANELFAALNDASSEEEIAASEEAEKAAEDAEIAFKEASAKADNPAAQGGNGSETAQEDPGAQASRTGYAKPGLRAGDECVCPDGRKGTVHSFDAGLICIPNHDQG